MKITGPGKGATDETGEVPGTPAAGQASEGTFAEQVGQVGGPEGVGGAAAKTAAGAVSGVAEIGAALAAGQVDAQQAIDLLVGKVLDQQVGPGASPALRVQVETALREALANDPILAGETRRLTR